jgi:hypothetical protein
MLAGDQGLLGVVHSGPGLLCTWLQQRLTPAGAAPVQQHGQLSAAAAGKQPTKGWLPQLLLLPLLLVEVLCTAVIAGASDPSLGLWWHHLLVLLLLQLQD